MYSIGQVAELTNMSQHTLRLYEEEGFFVEPIQRNSLGQRTYDRADVDWLQRLAILRSAGMPIAEITKYVLLVRASAPDRERIDVLREHRDRLVGELRDLREKVDIMDAKLATYQNRIDSGLTGAPWPEAKVRPFD